MNEMNEIHIWKAKMGWMNGVWQAKLLDQW